MSAAHRHSLPPGRGRPGSERRSCERRQGLSATQSREYRLRAAAQSVGVGVFDLDHDTGDCYWSAELKAIAGLPADAEVGLDDLARIVHPDDRERVLGKIRDILDPGGASDFLEDEHRLLRPDGSERWVKAMGRSFAAEEGGVRRIVGASGIVMDITALHATEDALRRSREQLDLAVRGAGIGIWSLNIKTGEVYWSERARQLFGIAADEHLSLAGFLSRLAADERESTAVRIEQALREHAEYRVEHRMQKPDGGERWVVVLGHGHYDERSEAVAMSGIMIDISDRKAAEIALRNRTEALQLALRAGHSGTFEWDARSRQFEWSEELLALYGLKREEFGGRYEDWLACLVEEDRSIAHEAMERAMREGEYSVYFRIRRRDTGDIRWMNGRGMLFFDPQGKPLRMVGINIDVTEQKRNEEMLRQHVSLLELAHEPIMVWGGEGMVFWNHGCQIQYGYTREEALGRCSSELLKTVYPIPFPAVQAQLESSGHWEGEIRQTTKDGRVLIETCRMQRFHMNGQARILAANRDITHRKEMEQNLRRLNEELEQKVQTRTAELAASKEALERTNLALSLSNQELREFAYVAAHDLQTPLRSIAGFARLLQQQYKDRLGPEADGWITLIVDNARRMHNLIRDVLNYSGVESKGEAFRPVDLERVVDEILVLISPRIEESGARVSRGSLPVVKGDPGQLAQLIQNLIENALTYRGPQPPEIGISASRGEKEWTIAVRDNGIGIDARHHESIFEAFRRLHTYKEYPGTGVGLSICRRIVHRHGGRIWVESEPGRGSTFYFSLPVLESGSGA